MRHSIVPVLAVWLLLACNKEVFTDNSLTHSSSHASMSNLKTLVLANGVSVTFNCDTAFITTSDTLPDLPTDTVPDLPTDTVPNLPTDTVPEPVAKPEIWFLGSSTIAQLNLAQTFPDHNARKVGLGGYTWTRLIAKADTIMKLGGKPDQIVIYSGDNDVLSKRSVANMTVDIQNLCQKLWQYHPDAHITFMYTKPSDTAFQIKYTDQTTGIQAIEYTNRNIANWGKNYHSHHFSAADIYSPLLLWNPKRLNTKYYQEDQLHLNQTYGYPRIKTVVEPLLMK